MKESFSVINLITKKRRGEEMTKDEIKSFIQKVVSSEVQDSQLGKFFTMFMAVYLCYVS